jgi:hypothetical protein
MNNFLKSCMLALSLLAIPENGFCTLIAEKKALNSIAKKIQEEEHLAMTNACSIDESSGKWQLSFKAEEEVQEQRARRLIVEVIEKFRVQGNEKWELYSRMEGGYVNTQNLDVAIDFSSESLGSVSRVTHQNGNLRYTLNDGSERQESYADALRSVYPVPVPLARKLIANHKKK